MTKAKCHPRKPHCAKGLCRECYDHKNKGKRLAWYRLNREHFCEAKRARYRRMHKETA